MSTVQIFKIDFDHLEKLDDLQIVPGTPEDAKAVSEFLKARRAKEARSEKARLITSRDAVAGRKKAKAVGK